MPQLNTFSVGIDVSKAKLDVAFSNASKVTTFDNQQKGFMKLIQVLKQNPPELVCLEATGGLERSIVDELNKHNFSVAIVNPRQIRDFARALNRLAKTDWPKPIGQNRRHRRTDHRRVRRTHPSKNHPTPV